MPVWRGGWYFATMLPPTYSMLRIGNTGVEGNERHIEGVDGKDSETAIDASISAWFPDVRPLLTASSVNTYKMHRHARVFLRLPSLGLARIWSEKLFMKILQLISGTSVNGALMHCKCLTRQLVRFGHDVTIACRPGSWLWSQLDDCPVRMVACGMKRWPLQELRKMADWIRREQFDVMHTHMSSANLFGTLLRRMTGVPVVATAHSRHVQPHWRWNDHVIANSEVTARYHRRFNRVSPERLSTVHCFVDTDRFASVDPGVYRGLRREWRFKPDSPVLMLAGNVVSQKGHHRLFRALPELTNRYPDLRVVLVGRFNRGERYCRTLRRFQLEHGLERKIRWIGKRDNMHEMLFAADLAVIPSRVESLGMVALECMAAGTPVIASRAGGLVELIQDSSNGLLVDGNDTDSMVDAISRIMDDADLKQHLIKEGQKTVRTDFSPVVLSRKIECCLHAVTQRAALRLSSSPPKIGRRALRNAG